jgi:hypothetical protein
VSEIMNKVGQLCDIRFKVKYRILRYGLTVVANSLLETAKEPPAPDLVREQRIFQPVDGVGLDCLTTGLSSSTGQLGRVKWTVTDSKNAECETVVIPIADPKKKMDRRVGIFFVPALQPGQSDREPYKLVEQSSVRGSMELLKKNGMDEISLENSGLVPYEHADLVLYVPENFPKFDYVPYSAIGEPVRSERMTTQQISQYGEIPLGFRGEGWTYENLKPGQGLGVRLSIPALVQRRSRP